MAILFGLLILSFLVNGFLFIPFINLLYYFRLQRKKQESQTLFREKTPIFSSFNAQKAGTPVGAGVLLIITTTFLFFFSLLLFYFFWVPITSVFNLFDEIKTLFFTFIFFAFLGIYDDFKKTFIIAKNGEFGLRLRHKLLIEIILALIISLFLYFDLKIGIIHIPFLGVFSLGLWYIPFAAFIIVAFANAYNITDGLDGLAGGVLLIVMLGFWVLSASILDTPLSLFIAIFIGGLIAFLYFNVYPARIMLGDSGALAFGAILAVIGLILGKTLALPFIGGVFVIEVASSLGQMLSKKFRGKKMMPVAPFHLYLQYKGWEEPKIVTRAWIIAIIFTCFGLFLAVIK